MHPFVQRYSRRVVLPSGRDRARTCRTGHVGRRNSLVVFMDASRDKARALVCGCGAEEQSDRWKHWTFCNEIDLTGSVGLDGMQVDNIVLARVATTDFCFRACGLQTLFQLHFCHRQ